MKKIDNHKNVLCKKISFEKLQTLYNTDKKFNGFIDQYISEYLSKFNTKNMPDFILKTKKIHEYFKTQDPKCVVSFVVLTDKTSHDTIAIEKILQTDRTIFKIPPFKNLIKEIKTPVKTVLYTTNLYINPKYSNQGYCKYLVGKIIQSCKKTT
jgi:hypothetical protein